MNSLAMNSLGMNYVEIEHTLLDVVQTLKRNICEEVYMHVVGGSVRDQFISRYTNNPFTLPKDLDVVITSPSSLLRVSDVTKYIQSVIPHAEYVGESFPVWKAKIYGVEIDIALGRKEIKTGLSRQEFEVITDGVTIEQDLYRRDFTINAIAIDLRTGKIVDPFNGIKHIKEWKLVPVSEAFKEDALRVYRGARFAARFGFNVDDMFYKYCSEITPLNVSNERIGMELIKTLKEAEKPSIFFQVLRKAGWLKYHFRELQDCIGVEQDPVHHPEGDVFNHTLLSMDEIPKSNPDAVILRATMLCHDLGKVITSHIGENGRIISPGHAEVGVNLADQMLKRIHLMNHSDISIIKTLVKHHMVHINPEGSRKLYRRIALELKDKGIPYSLLHQVCVADKNGRGPKEKVDESEVRSGYYYIQILEENNGVERIVTGKKLIELGLEPGKNMGVIIKKAEELQIEGELTDMNWIHLLVKNNLLKVQYHGS